ncbi:uncharacterized protein LOC129584980 [Paramacrobiotus metropolitanus]|uniref:uncharacterized protein LOC129584980 n=1 Tax=Paramacrobiotus metropolitanus TaxID=2943436 RepID=UPI002445F751|nr:uncharacterized protein LOC129584980 [Paramacrobiotus metropolitanus]XP_055333425.1 uncharacterized protein LOC129584980 [Paramacrobiotus metropolitanus]
MALLRAINVRLLMLIPVAVHQGVSGLDCWFCTTNETIKEPELLKLANDPNVFNACEPGGNLPSTAKEACPFYVGRVYYCGIFYYMDRRNKNNKIPISRRCIIAIYDTGPPVFSDAQPLFCYTEMVKGDRSYSCICRGSYCNNFSLAAIGIAVDNTNLPDNQKKPIPAGSSLSPVMPSSGSGSTGSASNSADNPALQSVAGNKESGDEVAASGQSPTSAGKGGSTNGSSNAAGSKESGPNVIVIIATVVVAAILLLIGGIVLYKHNHHHRRRRPEDEEEDENDEQSQR